MTFGEFRQWAWDCLGYRWPDGTNYCSAAYRAAWNMNYDSPTIASETGSGNPATYGPIQQRRLAFWLRARHLIDPFQIRYWLDAAETHDTGWLVNQGDGIYWTEDPAEDWKQLLATGFVAIRCGTEPNMKESE